MAADEIADWNIDISDDQLAGLIERPDSTRYTPTPKFTREQKFDRRLRLFNRGRQGSDAIFEQIDISSWDFEVGVGAIDRAPTSGTFSLSYGADTTGLTGLAYNITAAALKTALESNPTLTLISTFTVDAGTDVITTGAAHGLVEGDTFTVTNSGGGLPAPFVAGTVYYVKTAPTTTTLTAAATSGGATIDITTAGTGTHSIRLTVTVNKEDQLYTITFSAKGNRTELTPDAALLYPPSDVLVTTRVAGDSNNREIQTIEVIQEAWAFSDAWTPVAEGTVSASTISAGTDGTPAKFKVVFTEPPIEGTVRIDHAVPQIIEVTATANTASKAQFQIEFSPVALAADINSKYIDLYRSDDTIARLWFDLNNTGTAPTTPSGGVLIEVDYTNLTDIVTNTVTALNANAEFTSGASRLTATKVVCNYANHGTRASLSLDGVGASGLVSASTKMNTTGSDGTHAGKYFFVPDRNGIVCAYLTAGRTTTQPSPSITGVTINRFLPIAITINGAANTIAGEIATGFDGDPEFAATSASAIATITDAFGGERTSVTTANASKTFTGGVAVKRAGFTISASIPWESEVSTIEALLGDSYNVTKPDPLTWLITLATNGAMPTLTATDETLVWPSRVSGSLTFNTLAMAVAFETMASETDSTRVDGLLEIKGAPTGESLRVLLQVKCSCFKNMLRDGMGASTPFTGPLRSLPTYNTIWVMKNGDDSTGTRGRMDKPYLTLNAAETAATAADTVKVLNGSYLANSLGTKALIWDLDPGVVLTASVDNVFNLATAVSVVVRGNGARITSAGGQTLVVNHASATFKPTDLIIECTIAADNAIELSAGTVELDQCTINSVSAALTQSAGTLRARRSRFTASNAAANALERSGGTTVLHGNELVAGAGGAGISGSGTVRAWNNISNLAWSGVTESGAGNTVDSNLT